MVTFVNNIHISKDRKPRLQKGDALDSDTYIAQGRQTRQIIISLLLATMFLIFSSSEKYNSLENVKKFRIENPKKEMRLQLVLNISFKINFYTKTQTVKLIYRIGTVPHSSNTTLA